MLSVYQQTINIDNHKQHCDINHHLNHSKKSNELVIFLFLNLDFIHDVFNWAQKSKKNLNLIYFHN